MRSSKRQPRAGSLQDIYGALHRLVIGTVVLWILVAAIAAGGLVVVKRQQAAARRDEVLAIRALCAQRHNYDESIRSTQSFLRAHPHGIPGISRAVFLRSLRLTRQARAALADIHCN